MSYKDTLKLFDELVASGVPESQARIQAQQLGGMSDYLGEMTSKFDKRLDKIDTDLMWMRVIGAAMIVAFFSNGLSSWFR